MRCFSIQKILDWSMFSHTEIIIDPLIITKSVKIKLTCVSLCLLCSNNRTFCRLRSVMLDFPIHWIPIRKETLKIKTFWKCQNGNQILYRSCLKWFNMNNLSVPKILRKKEIWMPKISFGHNWQSIPKKHYPDSCHHAAWFMQYDECCTIPAILTHVMW